MTRMRRRVLGAAHDERRIGERFRSGREKFCEEAKGLFDEGFVAADKARHLHELVVDRELDAFAGEDFGEGDEGAFAEVVGAGFEGEALNADSARAGGEDGFNGAFDLAFITREDAGEYRGGDVALADHDETDSPAAWGTAWTNRGLR
jgi:hypothetical protein